MSAHMDGTKMPRINRADLASYKVPAPGHRIALAYNDFVQPLLDHIQSSNDESGVLAAICDALLPKLLSGEIRITGAELTAKAMG